MITRSHIIRSLTILYGFRVLDLDPAVTTYWNDKNNVTKLSFEEYVFRHGSRLRKREELSKVNSITSKVIILVETTIEEQFQKNNPKNNKPKRGICQRALGTFQRVVMTKDEVICNCENFKQFRNCFEATFFRLLCHDINETNFTEQDINSMGFISARYGIPENQWHFQFEYV